MKKKTLSKKLHAPILDLKFDETEMLLLLFVVITLLMFVSWQQGFLGPLISTSVLGASVAR